MHIAIVGAGYSGLISAHTLLSFGHEITIFDSSPDVGGVWSSTKSYPGLRSQNPKDQYAFSTLPMPKSYPLHPSGEQMRAYLEMFAKVKALREGERMKLSTEVVRAMPRDNGWVIEAKGPDGQITLSSFDYLVVATGVFSKPFIPSYPGLDQFEASGGQFIHTSQLRSSHIDECKRKSDNAVVVGYGKSACDAAVMIAATSQSGVESAGTTTIVARDVIWKLPTYIGGIVHYSYILMARFGEALFPYVRPWNSQQFLNEGPGRFIRWFLFWSLTQIISIQLKLRKFNLRPNKPFETIARSSVSLATVGFETALSSGKLKVQRDTTIISLGEHKVILSNGETLPADLVVCGTGWSHCIPSFLPREYESRLLNDKADWQLYRHILPDGIPNLAFVGFNSSIFCQLSSEVTALWLAAHLESVSHPPLKDGIQAGSGQAVLLSLPPEEKRREQAAIDADWSRRRTDGHHANGTSITPFTMSNIDEMMDDLNLKIGWGAYAKEWVFPINPAAYAGLLPTLIARRDKLRNSDKVSLVAIDSQIQLPNGWALGW